MNNNIPRCQHPRPDRKREAWINLNGEWDFEIDNALVGVYKNFFERKSLDSKIIVPFSAESVLSGIGHTDFINAVWYKRDLDIPADWAGKRVILHIDACDYTTTVYVNGKKVGTHSGGYTSFQFDITKYLAEEGNYVTVYAEDDIRSERQVSGKQSQVLYSRGCSYTRTTGIWQTVWLEAVENAYVESYRVYANISDPSVALDVVTSAASVGGILKVKASYEGKPMGEASATITSLCTAVSIDLAEKHLWEVGEGRLYDLKFELEKDGKTDILDGYFGLREVALTRENGLQVNGKTVFGRFVLDQGFYPDGIITAPNDEALIFDIKASMACGFNGARLHQKVFEPRFLYHADRLGYMVWDETGNWGLDHTVESAIYNFLPEWLEEIERDFSHPSIIGWCPTNETWDKHGRQQCNEFLDLVYDVTKSIDKTRPVITSSGSYPTERTDVHDVHDYEQNPEKFTYNYSEIEKGIVRDQIYRRSPDRQKCKTELPIFVSEYGGIKWVLGEDATAWGYGESVKTEDEFFARLKGLTDALLDNKDIFAFCYTQLTDVEQEQNGLLTYQRQFKFEPEKYAAIFGKKAAIEE
ncbi:MAG: beta-galactosidase [Ruminococcaceae bacterium]|nr:beta-galactosidase [Oscillospiraceae bacterium]